MEDRCHIRDFTEENYKRLLKIAKIKNDFISYEEAISADHGIIMRHDIDLSVHRAKALAEIEHQEDIQSTYFVHLHSILYNVLEKEIVLLLKEIVRKGHRIGLHFEPSFYDISDTQMDLLNFYAEKEKKILEDIVECPITCFSFHNPDSGGQWHLLETEKIANMINVYNPFFREKFQYCSDSNGYWRFQRLENVIENCKGKRLHILLHPVWWQQEAMYPYDRIKRSAIGRCEKSLGTYSQLLVEANRLNVKDK